MELNRKQEINHNEAKTLKAWLDRKIKNHPRVKKPEKPPYILRIREHVDLDLNYFYSCYGHVEEDVFRQNVYWFFWKRLGVIKRRYCRQEQKKKYDEGIKKDIHFFKIVYCNESDYGAEPIIVGIEKGIYGT